jgi:hypothetical protein
MPAGQIGSTSQERRTDAGKLEFFSTSLDAAVQLVSFIGAHGQNHTSAKTNQSEAHLSTCLVEGAPAANTSLLLAPPNNPPHLGPAEHLLALAPHAASSMLSTTACLPIHQRTRLEHADVASIHISGFFEEFAAMAAYKTLHYARGFMLGQPKSSPAFVRAISLSVVSNEEGKVRPRALPLALDRLPSLQ